METPIMRRRGTEHVDEAYYVYAKVTSIESFSLVSSGNPTRMSLTYEATAVCFSVSLQYHVYTSKSV